MTATTTKAPKTVKTPTVRNPRTPKAAPAAKPTTNYKAGGGITKAHVIVLTFLAKAKNPVTRQTIADKTGREVKYVGWDLGSAKEDRDPLSLLGRKLVKLTTIGGKDTDKPEVYAYEITAAGRKALEIAKAAK